MTNSNTLLAEELDPFAASAAVKLPATRAQQAMWLAGKAGGGAACVHNRSLSVRLQGQVSDSALEQAVRMLPEFHEALRGRFGDDGQSFIIEPSVDVPIAKYDLTGALGADLDQRLMEIVLQDSSTPYDLTTGPLFRAAVVLADLHTRVVLLSVHQAACDGWSLDVLLADFARLYSAVVGAGPLPDPPGHGFSDFVHAVESATTQAKIEVSRSFWRQAMAEMSRPRLERSSAGRYGACHAVLTVSPKLLDGMRAFAKARHVSLFTVLFSGYAVFLQRMTGTPDVVVGVPVAGHPEADMEDCVGHLANLAPVRLHLADTDSFASLCSQAGAVLLNARENAVVGIEEIATELAVPTAGTPLVTATFTHVQRYAPGKLLFADCTVDYAINPRSFNAFEISLDAMESKETLQLIAHADVELFSQQALLSRLREIEALFATLIADAESPLRGLASLSTLDRGDTVTPKETVSTLSAYFGQQIIRAQTFASPADALPSVQVHRSLSVEVVSLARAIARTYDVSVFSLLYATYARLLLQTNRRGETLVSFPVAPRSQSVAQSAASAPVDPNQTLIVLARQAHSAVIEEERNTQIHPQPLVAAFARKRNNDSSLQLCGTLAYEVNGEGPGLSDAAFAWSPTVGSTGDDALHVEARESNDGIDLRVQAQLGVFDEGGLAQFLADFESHLRKACDHPTSSALSLATPGGSPRRQSAVACGLADVDGSLSEAPIVVTLREGDPGKTPLLCILGIQLYIDLAMAMTDGTPVVGLHCPMYYTPGETSRPSLAQVAGRYVEAIQQRYPRGPYKLLGLCFGGVVAHEVARLLLATGAEVQLVAVLDIPLPSSLQLNWPKRAVALGRDLWAGPGAEIKRIAGVATKPIVERVLRRQGAVKYLAALGYVPQRSEPVDLPVLGPEAESDVASFAKQQGSLNTRLIVFRALKSDIPEWFDVDADMGWGAKARSFGTYTIDCDHMQIVRPPHCHEVAAILLRELSSRTK